MAKYRWYDDRTDSIRSAGSNAGGISWLDPNDSFAYLSAASSVPYTAAASFGVTFDLDTDLTVVGSDLSAEANDDLGGVSVITINTTGLYLYYAEIDYPNYGSSGWDGSPAVPSVGIDIYSLGTANLPWGNNNLSGERSPWSRTSYTTLVGTHYFRAGEQLSVHPAFWPQGAGGTPLDLSWAALAVGKVA